MKQLLILPTLLTAVVALPLLGKEQCAKGPAIWCQNIHTASQCGAVNHCRQMVWNKPTVKSMPCDLCKEVINVVDQFLKDNGTQIKIESYLNKICEFLHTKSWVSQCKDYVDAYLSVLMDLIKEELDDPEVVCGALHLCTPLQQYLASKQHQQLQSNEIPEVDMSQVVSPFLANVPLLLYPQKKPEQELQGDSDKICKECVQLITDVQEAVKSNTSFVENLVARVKNQCDKLPPGLADTCKNYISQYSELAVEWLMMEKPDDVCCFLGFCPALKSVPLQTLLPAKVNHVMEDTAVKNGLLLVKDSPTCVLCELVIKKIIGLLGNNRTEENIIQALDGVCALLPESLSEQCMDFVNEYAKAVVEILLQEASPSLVCSLLGLCANSKPLLVERVTPEQLRSGEFCNVCKFIVNYMDSILERNATEKKIEAALHKVCNFLPAPDQDQCNQLIALYAEEFLQLLLQMMDPEFVCTQLHVCMSVENPVLGSEECVWGPSYWCKSMETAAQCNAIEHCKHHVWN